MSQGNSSSSTLNRSTGRRSGGAFLPRAGKTPSRTPGRHNIGDRFIPNRSNLNVDVSYYLLTRDENTIGDMSGHQSQSILHESRSYPGGTSFLQESFANDTTHVSRAYSDIFLPDMSSFRIINCKENSMVTTPGRNKSGIDGRKSQGKMTKRNIPTQADKILDAPDVKNDYYLQLLDWGDNNLLGVALNNVVFVWNPETNDIIELCEMEGEDNYVSSLNWIIGHNTIAIGSSDSKVYLYDVETKKKLRTFRGHEDRVSSIGTYDAILSTGSRSGYIHHHDLRSPEMICGKSKNHEGEVCGLKWSPNGQYLASGGNDSRVVIWNKNCLGQMDTSFKAQNSTIQNCISKHQAAVKAVAWCPWKSNVLATGGGSADKTLRIWNTNTGENTSNVNTNSQVCSVLWNSHYKELISGHGFSLNQLILWKYENGSVRKFHELVGHADRVLTMSMSPDSETVVSLGADETLRFWNCFQVDKDKKKASELSYKESLSLSHLSIR